MKKTTGLYSQLFDDDNLFLSFSPNSEISSIIKECLQLLDKNPDILVHIRNDQDHYGTLKKIERLKDKRYLNNRSNNPLLINLDDTKMIELDSHNVSLEQGRSRMPEIAVFIFIVLRGYFSSMSDHFALNYLKESLSIHCFLQSINYKLPAKSTINDNLNCISSLTKDLILEKQLEMILVEGLDDFNQAYIDSTAVKGCVCWPTDAGIIFSYLSRVYINSQKLNKLFYVNNFKKVEHIDEKLKELKSLLFTINMTAGKAHSKGKIKKLYNKFLKLSKKVHDYLIKEFIRIEQNICEADLVPTKRKQLNKFWMKIEDDLSSVAYVIYYAEDRIFNGIVLKSTEKILSISEQSAAFIIKGGRVPVIGYKPQFSRSENGFLTSFTVKEGNLSDSSQLVPVFEDIIKNTKIIPEIVSTDDGYSSKIGRNTLLKEGVKVMSINGGKGKNITTDEEWHSNQYHEARNKRSGIESSIFTIKFLFKLNSVRRKGIDNVRAEMMEKVIAFNFYRILWVRNNELKKKKLVA